jgi:hypothetical protein
MMADFSYRINGMFALILPESPNGEAAMGQVMEMTDGTAKVFAYQLNALKADLHRAGYTIIKRERSKLRKCSHKLRRADLTVSEASGVVAGAGTQPGRMRTE